MTTQSDERGGDEMDKITEADKRILVAEREWAVSAWKMLDQVITDYMLGEVDGAMVSRVQHIARDIINR